MHVAAPEVVGLEEDREVAADVFELDAEILLGDERAHLAGGEVDRSRLEVPVGPAEHADERVVIGRRVQQLAPGDAPALRGGRAIGNAHDERAVGELGERAEARRGERGGTRARRRR